MSLGDLEIIQVIGQGSFGRVSLVRELSNPSNIFALKIVNKLKLSQADPNYHSIGNEQSILKFLSGCEK
jgi:serine/threonine protein kinase